jgi:FlgN protein
MDGREDWKGLHEELRENLEKEIRLTRELLSNLHQEEVSLMLHDTGTLNQVLQVRSEMLERLSFLRLCRIKTTEKIEKIASPKNQHPSLEEILPPLEENSSEILSLSDQLMALTEKMHRQDTQNQRIAALGDSVSYPQHQLPPQSRPKRKAAVATYNIKK